MRVNQHTVEPLDAKEVASLYLEGKPIRYLTDFYKVDKRRIYRALNEAGVTTRKATDHLKGNAHNRKKPLDKEVLEQLYLEERRSIKEIQTILGSRNVYYYLRKHGIPRRSPVEHLEGRGPVISAEGKERIRRAVSGPNAWNWRGGVVPQAAKYYQSKEWKELAFECKGRDGFTCQFCSSKLPKSRLRAHHIVARRNGGTDTLDNLVSLCNPCHMKAESGTLRFQDIRSRASVMEPIAAGASLQAASCLL